MIGGESPFCKTLVVPMVFPRNVATPRLAAVAFLVFGLFFLPAAHAQSLQVEGDPVLLVDGGQWMQPRWSPDGSRLAVTAARYEGISLVDVRTGEMEVLTEEEGAGYGFSWSADGEAILARVSRAEGRLRSHAVKLFDVVEREERMLTDYRPHMSTLPQWSDGEATAALVSRSGDVERIGTGRQAVASKAAVPVVAATEDGVRMVSSGTRSDLVRSFDDRSVVNVTPSPDGSKIAFEIVGGNLMVMDANGGNLRDLGVGYRPSWSPDGSWISFMVSEDDGYQFTASEIFAIRADGGERVQLTSTSGVTEMNPSWSPDGRSIAFDDAATGSIYILPVRY